MMKLFLMSGCLVGLVLMTGCASIEETYIPRTMGASRMGAPKDGLRLILSAREEVIRMGDPLRLEVTLRNEGPEAVWFPNDPHLIMVWVYPNGRNDNTMLDPPQPKHFTAHSATLLRPGDEVSEEFTLETYYFPRPGITEFLAVLKVPGSTNPALRPFWAGRATSNAFGILVVDEDDPYAARAVRLLPGSSKSS